MSLVSKSFSEIVTFSRSSNATRIGPTGLVEYAPHNLLLQSQTFDNASWIKVNSSVTANAASAPDGTVTADKLIATASTDFHYIDQSVTTPTGCTVSVYMKSGEYTSGSIFLTQGGNNGAIFNLTTGVVTSVSGAGNTASITSVGNGWYRCSVTNSGDPSDLIRIAPQNGALDSFTGDGASGIYIWGAQLAVGPYPLDYTPTTSAAVYGPRFDYDPVTLAARGLLVEEQRTNLLTYSEDISNADWTISAITVSANFGTSPDGTVNADKMVGKSSYPGTSWLLQTESLSASTIYTASVFLKRSGVRYAYVGTDNAANRCVFFDLQTGTVGNAATGYSGSIVAVGNDWYRCVVTINTSTASYAQQMLIGQTDTANSVTYTGNNVDGILVWGAQLENNPFASSYIPTVASTVTRSADVASVNTLSPWWNASAGTLYAESVSYNNLPRAFSIINTGSADIIGIGSSGTNLSRLYIETGGITQANLGVAYTGSTAKEAAAYAANDAIHCVNGTLSSQDTSVSLPTLNKVDIGYFPPAAAFHNGWIRRLAYYPRRLTNAELQALTA